MATQTLSAPGGSDYDTLVKELGHDVWEVRRDACEDLAAKGDKRAIPHLVRLLNDKVGAVRYAAVEALGKVAVGEKTVVPQIIRLLDSPYFGSYAPVIESLANLKAPEAIPYFIRLLRDEDPRVRNVSASALMVTTRQVIPFKAKGTPEEREVAIKQWESWWQANWEKVTPKQ